MLPVINVQPPELTDKSDGRRLEVHSIWYTIQGEGPFAGTPAVFLRLAGCNLQCPYCDTDYTRGRIKMPVDHIVHAIQSNLPLGIVNPLIVITGGEPFRQLLDPLLTALVEHPWQFRVQIETNGVLPHRLNLEAAYMRCLTVVCSPKTHRIHGDNRAIIDAYKYIVEDGQIGDGGLPTSSLGYGMEVARPREGAEVYIQPLDCKDPVANERHRTAAIEVCKKFGYRLCLQIHKLIGED